jgi:hypothetical protein
MMYPDCHKYQIKVNAMVRKPIYKNQTPCKHHLLLYITGNDMHNMQ